MKCSTFAVVSRMGSISFNVDGDQYDVLVSVEGLVVEESHSESVIVVIGMSISLQLSGIS